MEHCQNFTGLLIAYDEQKNLYIRRTRCKQWDCPYCAVKNREIWQAHLMAKFNQIGFYDEYYWYLVTITCDGRDRRSHTTLRALQDNWNKIAQLFRDHARKTGGKADYVRVFELHKEDEAGERAFHLHAILRTTMLYENSSWQQRGKKKRFKDYTVSKPGLGFMSEIKPLPEAHRSAGRAQYYVTKYLSKELQDYSAPKRWRRVSPSRAWGKGSEGGSESVLMWDIVHALNTRMAWVSWEVGAVIVDLDKKSVITSDDFIDKELYR